MAALEKGKQAPNWKFKDQEGKTHALWDFRQKHHTILIYEPKTTVEKARQWQQAIHADRQQWDWLNVRFFILKKAPAELLPGAYVIDRYGRLWNYFSSDHWSFADLEKDLIYYEARHC